MKGITNNVDFSRLAGTEETASGNGGHFHVEKHIDGEFHMEGSPMFTAELSSEHARFTMGADEPGVLGGQGVHTTPLSYLLFGVMSCYASTVAIQAGMKGVELKKLKVRGSLYYDIGPVVSGIDTPIIKSLKLELDSDRDLKEIIGISNQRCPALYAISHGVETEVTQA